MKSHYLVKAMLPPTYEESVNGVDGTIMDRDSIEVNVFVINVSIRARK